MEAGEECNWMDELDGWMDWIGLDWIGWIDGLDGGRVRSTIRPSTWSQPNTPLLMAHAPEY
jgi:hypothetical protein